MEDNTKKQFTQNEENVEKIQTEAKNQTENTKKLLECYSEFLQSLTKENLQEKFEIAKKNKINFTNFDVLQILDLSVINIENFVKYKKGGCVMKGHTIADDIVDIMK